LGFGGVVGSWCYGWCVGSGVLFFGWLDVLVGSGVWVWGVLGLYFIVLWGVFGWVGVVVGVGWGGRFLG